MLVPELKVLLVVQQMPLLLCLGDEVGLVRLASNRSEMSRFGHFYFLLKFVQLLPSILPHSFDHLIADLFVSRLADFICSLGLVVSRFTLLAKVETHDVVCVLWQDRLRWRDSRPGIAPHVGWLILCLNRHLDAAFAAL